MKTLAMYRPNTIQNALDNFDFYFGSIFGDSILSPPAKVSSHLPSVDIRETEESYVLDMELPGYDAKNIDIHIDGASLSVASKQEEIRDASDNGSAGNKDSAENQGTWILKERRINSFTRSFKLPENANPEEVTAEFNNGILTMEIKKRAEALKRAIQISAK